MNSFFRLRRVSMHYLSVAALAIFLSSCSLLGGESTDNGDALHVTSARYAITFGDIQHGPRQRLNRPTASLGIFAGLFLAAGNFMHTQSALAGVAAQAAFHALPGDDQLDATFALLQEFGTVLQVDVPDLLNRSDNRPQTFNSYLAGLANITERSSRRAEEVEVALDTLQDTQRTQRRAVSDLERAIRNAITAKDYATAGELQSQLGAAQKMLTETESDIAQQEIVQNSLEDLLDIAAEQKLVLEENREVIIAGLRVINLPGADSLGILENAANRRR